MIRDTLVQVRRQTDLQLGRLKIERTGTQRQLRDEYAQLGKLAGVSVASDPRLADAHDRIRVAERRITEIDDELAALDGGIIDETEAAEALAEFDGLWEALAPREQSRVIELLVERGGASGLRCNYGHDSSPVECDA